MMLAVALCLMIVIYAPRYFHEYQAPKSYLLALVVFGGLVSLSPVCVSGELPGLILADLLLHALHLGRRTDRETLFTHALLIGWAAIIAAHGQVQWLLYAILGASAVIAVIALIEFAGYGRKYVQDFGRFRCQNAFFGWRPAGPLGNPDVLGSFSAAVLPLTLAPFFPFNTLLALVSLGLSFARASWLTVGLPGLPFISSYLWLQRKAILADPSVQDRFRYYRCAWALIQKNPLWGHGVGSFKFLSQPIFRRPRLQHIHCEWLELWVEVGGIGLGLRLTIVAVSIWSLFQNGNIALALALLILCVDGCFSLSLRTIAVQVLFWTIIGISMSVFVTPGTDNFGYWRVPLLIAIPNTAILFLMSDRHFKVGASLLLGGNLECLKHLLKAVQCNPFHRDARYALALACEQAGQLGIAKQQMMKLARIDPDYLEDDHQRLADDQERQGLGEAAQENRDQIEQAEAAHYQEDCVQPAFSQQKFFQRWQQRQKDGGDTQNLRQDDRGLPGDSEQPAHDDGTQQNDDAAHAKIDYGEPRQETPQ